MDMVKHAMAGAGAGAGAAAAGADSTNQTPSSGNDNKLYKGVRKRKWGKWVSEIRLPNSRERIWLGSYDSPEKAARAFDAALYCLRGRHASFNFPDTPFNLNINNVAAAGDQSLTPLEIQEVAAKFANEDLPLVDNNQEPSQSQSQSQPQPQQRRGANSLSESHIVTESTYTTASSSSTMYECEGTLQVDHGDMSTIDWTFLNMLDDSSEALVGSDYGLYSELHNMHSGELLYSTPPPPPFEDNVDQFEGDDPFSHQSSLWNWNF